MTKYITGFIGAALGVALLLLGIPRFQGVLTYSEISGLEDLQREEGSLTVEQLVQLQQGYDAILEAHVNSEYLSRKMQAEMALIELDYDNAEVWREKLEATSEALLSLGPANPKAWSVLAYARELTKEPFSGSEQAFSMSVLTGGYERNLHPFILRYGFRHWDQILEEERAHLEDIIVQMEQVNRGDLVRIAISKPDHLVRIINVLSSDEDAMARFVTLLNRTRR